MKKILFAVTTDLNYDQRMQRICSTLQKAGYMVTLVGRVWPVSRDLVLQPYGQLRLSCRFNRGKLFYLEYNLRLFFLLLSRRDDAYCAIDLDTALPVYFKAWLNQKPFVYDAHEYFSETPEVVRRPAVRWFWQRVEGFILRRTRQVYTVSASIAAVFESKYGVHPAVIRNLPLARHPEPETDPKPPPYILYQGAVNEGRGLEALIQAMPAVDLPLVICGQGDILPALQNQVENLNLQTKVTFSGYVLPRDLIRITAGARVGIMLLAPLGKSYYYSLANKFFDYVQAGVPQLMPDFPEYRALNHRYQVGLFCDLDPANIAAALNALIRDQGLYEKIKDNCAAARLEWTWESEEKELIQFYRKIWT